MTEQIQILDITIHSLTLKEAVAVAMKYARGAIPRLIMTPNAEILHMAYRVKEVKDLLNQSDLRVADGSGLLWAAQYNGTPLPERVTGIDLMLGLLEMAAQYGLRVFFLGAQPDVVAKARVNAESQWPGLIVCGVHDGYFDALEEQQLLEDIRGAKPDLLFVGMGAPKQEQWMVNHRDVLNVPLMMGVGGSFDVLSGHLSRAPFWIQKAGLEWLYRLYREPRRLKRMFALPLFLGAVVRHKYTGRRHTDNYE